MEIILTKKERYAQLIKSCQAMVAQEGDVIANLANICALIKEQMSFFWVGFYLVKEEQLVLGPFQGPVACTRIGYGKGVCGTAWASNTLLVVPDVHAFEGHIACSSLSQSEVVCPIVKDGEVTMVLDIDSASLNDFDDVDRDGIAAIGKIVERFL